MRVLLCFQLTRNVRFNRNMYNFKFNYLSRGQLVSLNLDKIFLPLLKILPCYEAFFGNLFFAINARMLCGNHLNGRHWKSKSVRIWRLDNFCSWSWNTWRPSFDISKEELSFFTPRTRSQVKSFHFSLSSELFCS